MEKGVGKRVVRGGCGEDNVWRWGVGRRVRGGGCGEVRTVDSWRCGVGGMGRIVCCTFIRHLKA